MFRSALSYVISTVLLLPSARANIVQLPGWNSYVTQAATAGADRKQVSLDSPFAGNTNILNASHAATGQAITSTLRSSSTKIELDFVGNVAPGTVNAAGVATSLLYTFQVTTRSMYVLSGSLATSYPGWPVGETATLWEGTRSEVVLYNEVDKGGTTSSSTLTLGSATFSAGGMYNNAIQGATSGILEVGRQYRINFSPSSSGPPSSWAGPLNIQGHYELAVMPVPVPGAAILVLLGLGTIVGGRRVFGVLLTTPLS